jgi:hypothetical protein
MIMHHIFKSSDMKSHSVYFIKRFGFILNRVCKKALNLIIENMSFEPAASEKLQSLFVPTSIVLSTSGSRIYASTLTYNHDKFNYLKNHHICMVAHLNP